MIHLLVHFKLFIAKGGCPCDLSKFPSGNNSGITQSGNHHKGYDVQVAPRLATVFSSIFYLFFYYVFFLKPFSLEVRLFIYLLTYLFIFYFASIFRLMQAFL